MKRHLDVEEILTELQSLAEDSTGPATVAILACMDVVERHGRIADEAKIKARVPEAGPTDDVADVTFDDETGEPDRVIWGPRRPLDSTNPRLKLRGRGDL